MANTKARSVHKIVTAMGVVLLFTIGFFIIKLFIDIQVILKYNYTPIPFTFILPFVGALIGFLLASKTVGLHK